MFQKARQILEILLLGVIVMYGICVILLFFSWSPALWSEKAAGWAQAIGAALAIFAAIGLASSENRRRNREARLLAYVALTGLGNTVNKACRALREIVAPMQHNMSSAVLEHDLSDIASTIECIGLWKMDDVKAAAIQATKVAARLSLCRSELDFVLAAMRQMEHDKLHLNQTELHQRGTALLDNLTSLLGVLGTAQKECVEFLLKRPT